MLTFTKYENIETMKLEKHQKEGESTFINVNKIFLGY